MELRVGYIKNQVMALGPGTRFVIWTQGCSHNCPNCHNPITHDFNGGDLVELDDVIEELENLSGQDGVTFSGGDPMFQPKQCSILAEKVHKLGMNVWAYTGFTFEELLEKGSKDILEFLSNIDVLIDGKFNPSLKSLDCPFRGSTNQRLIDVPKSLDSHEVVLYNLNKKTINNKKKEAIYI